MGNRADKVVCGAGMVGVACAYHLAQAGGGDGVVLVDSGEPLGLTSSKGTEGFRAWWPDEAMAGLIGRSLDAMTTLDESSGGGVGLDPRGYVFLTPHESKLEQWREQVPELVASNGGELRVDRWDESARDGADLVSDRGWIRRRFPWVRDDVAGLLWVRRAGFMDSRSLGMTMLDAARDAGVRVVRGTVTGVSTRSGRVSKVHLEDGSTIETSCFVAAPGPHLRGVGRMLGVELPVFCELHGKVRFEDDDRVIPADVPLTIWDEPVTLAWTDEERAALVEAGQERQLGELAAGVHVRARSETERWIVWTWDAVRLETPVWPLPFPSGYSRSLLRGLEVMVPGLDRYRDAPATADGGWYCRTPENRPLIGPLPIEGAYVAAAMSGFGIMGAMGAGELLAAHVEESPLPAWADAFRLERYDDPAYRAALEAGHDDGQL